LEEIYDGKEKATGQTPEHGGTLNQVPVRERAIKDFQKKENWGRARPSQGDHRRKREDEKSGSEWAVVMPEDLEKGLDHRLQEERKVEEVKLRRSNTIAASETKLTLVKREIRDNDRMV